MLHLLLHASGQLPPRRSGPAKEQGRTLTPARKIACSMIAVDHLRRSEAADGCPGVTAGGGHCCTAVPYGKGATVAAMPVWAVRATDDRRQLSFSRQLDSRVRRTRSFRARPRPADLGR